MILSNTDLLKAIVTAAGGTPKFSDGSYLLLRRWLVAVGGTPAFLDSHQKLAEKILVANGGTPKFCDSITNIFQRLAATGSGHSVNDCLKVILAALVAIPPSPPPSPPNAPSMSSASKTNTSVTLGWDNDPTVTSYRVDLSLLADYSTFVGSYENLNIGNVDSYEFTGLSAVTQYFYRVRAVNGDGTSPSASGSVTTFPNPPAAPVATAASAPAETAFTAHWNAASGATGYRLDVSIANDFSSFVSGFEDLDVSSVTSYGVTGLTGGTTYYYRVRAYNTGGTSGQSNTITTLTIPAAPVADDALGDSFSWTAFWEATVGATAYHLTVSLEDGGAFTSIVLDNQNVGPVLSYDLSDVITNYGEGNYYYRVKASNSSGLGANSNTKTFLATA